MTTSSTQEQVRNGSLLGGLASVSTLRVQPVKPEQESNQELFTEFIGSLVVSFLSALFLMLGANALHRYYPAVAPLGYWDCWFILLGVGTAAWTLTRTAAFKWARR